VEGFGQAVAAAFDYGLEVVERAGTTPPPVPPVLRAQARLAARHKVGLETVLRRYAAGHALLVDFLIEETERGGDVAPAEVRRLLRQSARGVDLILLAVADEYAREAHSEQCGYGGRRLKAVELLLAGEPLEPTELRYELEGLHVAMILRGEDEGLLRSLAQELDRRLLVVSPNPRVFWGWLGGRRDLDPTVLIERAGRHLGPNQALALGEPAADLAGWRLSHRQARIASEYTDPESKEVSRYADVAVLSSLAKDPVLVESLRRLFLAPLDHGIGQGRTLRNTLKEYFAAGGNISSAAAALNVNRETVRNRLRTVEERLGCSIAGRSLELQAALELEEIH